MALFAPPFWLNRSQMRSLFSEVESRLGIDGVVRPVFEGLQDPRSLREGFPGGEAVGNADPDGGGAVSL